MTADFITPVVDDPFIYGQIAAANALSDIFAMGGEAKNVLNLLMWDSQHISKEELQEILRGGLDKTEEAGAILVGGHTIEDREQKYGLSVMGIAHPKHFWKNNTPKIGDSLILTKPLGSGILTTAIKAGMASPQTTQKIANIMSELNLQAKRVAQNFDIHACTDITGFGLIGHTLEMLGGLTPHSREYSALFFSGEIPIVQEAIEFMEMGIIPGGSYKNKDTFLPFVEFKSNCAKEQSLLFFDAQTSGGLLFALQHSQSIKLVDSLQKQGIQAKIIGEIIPFNKTYPIILG